MYSLEAAPTTNWATRSRRVNARRVPSTHFDIAASVGLPTRDGPRLALFDWEIDTVLVPAHINTTRNSESPARGTDFRNSCFALIFDLASMTSVKGCSPCSGFTFSNQSFVKTANHNRPKLQKFLPTEETHSRSGSRPAAHWLR